MLNKIILFSLKNRLTVSIVSIILLIAGTFTVQRMDVDVFPDLTAPTVVVMTEAHGMAPSEVERLVSFPIETAVNGARSIRRVRSSSAMGFSLVWAEFDWGTDIYKARQTITERLIQVNEALPENVGKPVIAPQSSLMGEIIVFAITSDSLSPIDLRTFAEWNIRPRLLAVGGVAQVLTIGGEAKEYQILANPEKMKFYNVSLHELSNAANASNDNSSGGFFNQYGNEYIVRGLARTNRIEELENALIKMKNGAPVRIKDVADVRIGGAPKLGDASFNTKRAVIVTVTKQPGINTIELTEKINEELKKIEKNSASRINYHYGIMEQAEFIKTSIDNVKKALIEGAILVVIILFVFLVNFRTTIISVLAIPLSLLASILMLKLLNISINTMTLGGMAIAIGSLVDDAIIDVENVYKRLKQNYRKPKKERKSTLKVIYKASQEIRSSILNATLIIIVAFIPLFFLSGMEGRMLKPLGIAYIVALFASLLVAITITPVLCKLLLTNKGSLEKQEVGSHFSRWLIKHYENSLSRIVKSSKWIIVTTTLLFLIAVGAFLTFGRDFLPPFNEGALTINLASMPGISLEESNKAGLKAERLLLAMPEIDKVGRRTGRAELAEHAFGVSISELDIPYTLKERSRSEFLSDVRTKLNSLKGLNVEVGQPITHRINHMLSGSKAAIAIKLFGTDLNKMFILANDIKDKVGDIEGIGDLNVEQQVEIPQIKIFPKREMLSRYGIPMNEFIEYIDIAFGGRKVSDVFEGEQAFSLVVRFKDEYRDNIDAIRNAMIDTYDGKKIPLHYVAEIKSSFGANTISREKVMRKIVISVNTADRDVGSVVKDIKNKIDETVELPEDYWVDYGGQFKSAASATRILLFTSLLAILVIFMLLYQEFRSAGLSLIILLNLPLALIGGVMAIFFHSGVLSIPSIIGFITLFGIATRNGILLISRYKALQRQGVSINECIIRGSTDRLIPILMTALTAALALIPLAIAGDKPGNEIQSPMAVVILGGLLSSTLLNVYVIPIVYKFYFEKLVKK